MGLADLCDDFLGGLLGDIGDGELEDVALGDGGLEAGAGVEIHQLAGDGQAQVGEQDFGGDGGWIKHDEVVGADVLVLVGSNDRAEAADGADGGGDDVALVNLLGGSAGGFSQRNDFACSGAVAAQAADLNAVEGVGITRHVKRAWPLRFWRISKANGLRYASPGQRPEFGFRIRLSPIGAGQTVMCAGGVFCVAPSGLRYHGAHYPGRCPGLVWTAPLALSDQRHHAGPGRHRGW